MTKVATTPGVPSPSTVAFLQVEGIVSCELVRRRRQEIAKRSIQWGLTARSVQWGLAARDLLRACELRRGRRLSLKACALSLGVQQVRSLWKGAPVGPMRDQCHLRTYQRQCAPEVALDSPGVLLRGLSARRGRLRPAWTRTVLAPGCKGPSCPAQCVGTGPFMVLNGRTVVSAARWSV